MDNKQTERAARTEGSPAQSQPTRKIAPGSHAPASMPPATFASFGDYQLVEEIARGGMGVVYRARQTSLNRTVALKMILGGHLAGEAEVRRFRTEAEAAASLDHPHIVPIYEVGENAGQHYFAMRLIEGQSLAHVIDRFVPDPRGAAQLLVTVARALHYAHQRGILHRDLKPANILLDLQGQPHITDFGLAKQVGKESGLTSTGALLGTPNYMAPEQASGKTNRLTTAADIHSLGAILYHLLTGVPPFDTDSPFDTLRRLIEQEPTRPSAIRRGVDRDLETICLKCLEKDPARRYGSAEALAEDLERWLRHEPVVARRASVTWRVKKWSQRNPRLAAALVLLHLVSALGLAGILVQWRRAQDARQTAIEQLRESYLAQARALRFSGRPGRRFDSLDVLAKAAAIRPSLELRNEVMACLPLLDLKPVQQREFTLIQQRAFFDPALERYAVGDTNGHVVLHRLANGEAIARLSVSPRRSVPSEVRWSPDGRFCCVLYPSVSGIVWNLATGRQILTLDTDQAEFSSDSQQLFVAERSGGLSRYSLTTLQKHPTLAASERFRWPACDPSAQRLAAVTEPDRSTIVVLDVQSGQELARLRHTNALHGFVWHPDGRFLAAAANSQTSIRIWDLQTRTITRSLDDPRSAPVSLAFHPNGTLLAAGGWDGKVRLWEFETGKHLLSADGGGFVRFSSDGQKLGVVSWARDALWHFDLALGTELQVIQETPPAREGGERLTFNRNGTMLAHTIGGQVKVRNPHTGGEWAVLTNLAIENVLPDPSGSGFCLSSSQAWYRWPLELSASENQFQLAPLQQVAPLRGYFWAAHSAGGKTILAQHGPDHFHVLDGQTFKSTARSATNHPGLRYHALSPDGRWAASGAWHNPTVKIWDARSGDLVRTIVTEDMSSVAFSPDNRWLVIGGKDYQFLEVGTWTPVRRLKRPPMERFPPAMAFSRDGAILALCHTWRTVRLIRPDTGEELVTLEPPVPWNISSLSFNADASLLAVAGSLPEFHIWNLRLARRHLASMGLDWDSPPLAAEPSKPASPRTSP